MFYSDNPARYAYPATNRDASHGRFDIPHAVIYMDYNFGNGWKFSSEIEFEHGGTGTTYEIEVDEAGEYETELEKGGEVALEQFWIEKTFTPAARVRVGHIVVPVGLTNQYHLPTEYFTVLRPEEESEILPCTWHQTGISFRGKADKWGYEAQFLSGLDAERFNNANWIKKGATSPYEFEIANAYAGAFRVDNYSVSGLRMALSGYYGNSARNSLKWDRYTNQNLKGAVSIGAFDAVYNAHHVLARASVIYGHLDDSYAISNVNKKLPSAGPSPRTDVASDVMSYYVEAGYDLFSLLSSPKENENCYVFGHYGAYDSMYKTAGNISPKGWSSKNVISAGINYFPLKDIAVKAEYAFRKFKSPYNNEPTFSLGIVYAGLFN
ncbi:hypothetical protein FACS1894123_04510 [Bacteroidia bacterium]|nr:hypothetical protein FACS1894123_04510 [Bacteroidia bacterium]